MEATGFAVVIMAAGKGTRLNSKRPKVLHEVGGCALLLHVIRAANTLGSKEIYCIVGHQAERVQAAVAATGVAFVPQPEQRGTGHAMQVLKAWLETSGAPIPKNLLVLSGDVPLIRPQTLAALCRLHLQERAAMTILTAVPKDPTGYGRVLRLTPGQPDVVAIVEQKALTPAQRASPEINSGIYAFETEALFGNLDQLTNDNAHGEFILTDMAGLLVAGGKRVVALQAERSDEVLGANTIAEMIALDAMRAANAQRLMAHGVTIFRPDTCVIDAEVRSAQIPSSSRTCSFWAQRESARSALSAPTRWSSTPSWATASLYATDASSTAPRLATALSSALTPTCGRRAGSARTPM